MNDHADTPNLPLIEVVNDAGETVAIANTEQMAESIGELLYWMTDVDRGEQGMEWFLQRAKTDPEIPTHALCTVLALGKSIFPTLLAALDARGISPDEVRSIMRGEIE